MRITIYIPDDTHMLNIIARNTNFKIISDNELKLMGHMNTCITCKGKFLSVRQAKYCCSSCKRLAYKGR
jgi:hypothetical protein